MPGNYKNTWITKIFSYNFDLHLALMILYFYGPEDFRLKNNYPFFSEPLDNPYIQVILDNRGILKTLGKNSYNKGQRGFLYFHQVNGWFRIRGDQIRSNFKCFISDF